MPVVDFRELTVADDPSSKLDFTTSGSGGSGTLTVANDPSSKADLTTAPGSSFSRSYGPLVLATDGSSKINLTRSAGSRFGTLTLVVDGSAKFNAIAGPRRMGPTTVAGIPISGQIWPRANAGV